MMGLIRICILVTHTTDFSCLTAHRTAAGGSDTKGQGSQAGQGGHDPANRRRASTAGFETQNPAFAAGGAGNHSSTNPAFRKAQRCASLLAELVDLSRFPTAHLCLVTGQMASPHLALLDLT